MDGPARKSRRDTLGETTERRVAQNGAWTDAMTPDDDNAWAWACVALACAAALFIAAAVAPAG